MKFEKDLKPERLEEMLQFDIPLLNQMLDNMFIDEEMTAYNTYDGQYSKEYHFAIRGNDWKAVVQYERKRD